MRSRTVLLAMLGILLGCGGAVVEPPANTLKYTPPLPPLATPDTLVARQSWTQCSAGAAKLYQEAGPIYQAFYESQSGMLVTQYVLCADGTFLLQLQSGRWGQSEYLGKYSPSDSTVTFDFAASNLAGAWNAVGKLRGDTMTVVYNDVMVTADFIGGPYLRQAVP